MRANSLVAKRKQLGLEKGQKESSEDRMDLTNRQIKVSDKPVKPEAPKPLGEEVQVSGVERWVTGPLRGL